MSYKRKDRKDLPSVWVLNQLLVRETNRYKVRKDTELGRKSDNQKRYLKNMKRKSGYNNELIFKNQLS